MLSSKYLGLSAETSSMVFSTKKAQRASRCRQWISAATLAST